MNTRVGAFLAILPLVACSVDPSSDATEAGAESDLVSKLVVAAAEGGTTTKAIAISGATRLETPETYNWTCGRSNSGWSRPATNVAWVEIQNATPKTASVSVALESQPSTRATLFAYGSKSDPLTQCRVFGDGKLTGNDSVVLAPGKSAWLLVDVGTSTGAFTLSAKTDRLVDAKANMPIATTEGGSAKIDVPIDGAARTATPETYNWSCGRSNAGWSRPATNSAWVEIQNTTTSIAALTVEVDGPGSRSTLFAYASKNASLQECLVFGTSRKLGGSSTLIVPPHESAWLLVDAGTDTGLAELTVTTDRLLADTGGKVTIGGTAGAAVKTSVSIDGRARASTPETYNWSCGQSNGGWSKPAANVGWLEIVNPHPSTASLNVSVEASQSSRKPNMFAYASKSASPMACLTFTTNGTFSGSRSVVVEGNSSVWVLIDGSTDTGIYDLAVTTDALIEE